MGNLLCGNVDTLQVGWSISEFKLGPEEWEKLADAKRNAQVSQWGKDGSPVDFQGCRFALMPRGNHGYEYVLVNNDLTVMIAARATGGSSYPEVEVIFRSEYLWRFGWRGCASRVKKWVGTWAEICGEKLARVDLCVDLNVAVPDVRVNQGEVVSRAVNKSEFFVQHHLQGLTDTGYTFGQGAARCRVYDKLVEIRNSKKEWFKAIWKRAGWDGTSAVTRVEFQLRRDFLRSVVGELVDQETGELLNCDGINTLEDLERYMGSLWVYLSGWVSLRDQNPGDSNRRRWKLKPFWQLVIDARMLFGKMAGIRRLTQRKPAIDLIKRQARGLLVTLAACHQASEDLSIRGAMKLVAHTFFNEWLDDPLFREDIERRAGRLAGFG